MTFDVLTESGTGHGPTQIEKINVYMALHAIHMDYIMRAHVTHWYGPTADHPGGWCKCYRGRLVSLGDRAAQRAGVRSNCNLGLCVIVWPGIQVLCVIILGASHKA